MRILFVHQNFPGQFVHLAPALKARGHHVTVLTDASNQRNLGYSTARYAYTPRKTRASEMGLAAGVVPTLDRGEVAAHAAAILRSKHDYVPDLIIGNPGWGEMLFLKEVWPDATLIIYAEFFYRPHGLDTNFDPEFQKAGLAGDIWVSARQAPLLMSINAADRAISPTHWQARSFPEPYRDRITVIHDGIDTDRVAPLPTAERDLKSQPVRLRAGEEILTFANRNLEPYRGYHIFMRALSKILAARPNARVVIVGEDGVSYSTPAPAGRTWKNIFLDEVRDRIDLGRVHFVGRIPYSSFVDLMRITRVHAYLTYPFVLSWSMLEAMSAGALVVASRTPPVEEVIDDGINGRLVDFFDVDGWSETLIEALANPDRFRDLRMAGRQTIVDRYDLKSSCLPQLVRFVEQPQ